MLLVRLRIKRRGVMAFNVPRQINTSDFNPTALFAIQYSFTLGMSLTACLFCCVIHALRERLVPRMIVFLFSLTLA